MSYLPSLYRSNFVKDFSSSVRIHESVLMSSFIHSFIHSKLILFIHCKSRLDFSGGSRGAATSKMERFVIIVNGFQPLTIITKRSILDVAAPLDPPLDL